MSYSSMLLFPTRGSYRTFAEYPNSHRGHTLVWSAVAAWFGKDRGIPESAPFFYSEPNAKELERKFWKLTEDATIPRVYRLVLAMTYDHALVRREELLTFADAIDEFVMDLPLRYGAGHLPIWAKDFRGLAKTRRRFTAVGFIGTSVADDIWRVVKDNGEETRGHDLSLDSGHYFASDLCPADAPPADDGTILSRLARTMPPRVTYFTRRPS